MTSRVCEFSRAVPLVRLRSGALRQEITATPAECKALAGRFGLIALDRLSAAVDLRRLEDGTVSLESTFDAAFVQSCVVTLDPVQSTLSGRFSLVYGSGNAEQREITLAVEDPTFEPLTGDAIDVGEAVAQELSLQLPQFPRLPNSIIAAGTQTEPPTAPFARLAQLRGRGSH